MRVGDEYRIQTVESTAWNDEFLSQCSQLANESHRVEAERDDRIRRKFGELVRKLSLTQGSSLVNREISPIFDAQLPKDAEQRICVWVRDGWTIDDNSIRADARQAGNQSPTIFVYIPKRSADDLRRQLIDFKAANSTLEKRGVPNTPEGAEARAAMETTRQTSEAKINELLDDSFSGARVFQAGGNEILGNSLQEMISEAADNSLQRLFPNFSLADNKGWAKVYEKAQKGAPDALKAVGDDGEPERNPVCKAVLGFIAGGRKGADIRSNFEGSTYGWSRDAVDGALQVLLVAGLLRAENERGQVIDPRELERKAIGKFTFKIESANVTTPQRIQIRKVMQKIGITAKQGEELASVPQFLAKWLIWQSGPVAMPQNQHCRKRFSRRYPPYCRQRAVTGHLQPPRRNHGAYRYLVGPCRTQSNAGRTWLTLQHLLKHAAGVRMPGHSGPGRSSEQQRQLLEEPDPVMPLINGLTQLLRDEMNLIRKNWAAEQHAGEEKLAHDPNWHKLEPEQRQELCNQHGLLESAAPVIEVNTTEAILKSLDTVGISALKDRVAAMPGRFSQVQMQAAKMLEPEVQQISLPTPTLKSEKDVDAWLADVRQLLVEQLKKGPVIPK